MDPNLIHKVDTNNAENLFSMWTGTSEQHTRAPHGRVTNPLSSSLFQMCRFGRAGSEVRKPQLAAVEQRNVLLRDHKGRVLPHVHCQE